MVYATNRTDPPARTNLWASGGRTPTLPCSPVFRRLLTSPDAARNGYLIDKILPYGRISLCAAISSGGKSRFLTPSLIMWAAGLPVMGLRSWPVPWAMVCRDRPLQDALDMLKSMGFSSEDVPIIPAYGQHSKPKHQIINEIEDLGAKLVLWEGFDLMVRSPNNPHEVGEFLSEMSAYCEQGLTIIGTVGIAKLKPYEMYSNPRQLVAGSSIWERSTSSNLIVVARRPGDVEDPRRVMFACLKNDPSFTVNGKFDESGILVFDDWADRLTGPSLREVLADVRGVKGKKR